jgi:hypothetical protein
VRFAFYSRDIYPRFIEHNVVVGTFIVCISHFFL